MKVSGCFWSGSVVFVFWLFVCVFGWLVWLVLLGDFWGINGDQCLIFLCCWWWYWCCYVLFFPFHWRMEDGDCDYGSYINNFSSLQFAADFCIILIYCGRRNLRLYIIWPTIGWGGTWVQCKQNFSNTPSNKVCTTVNCVEKRPIRTWREIDFWIFDCLLCIV